MTRRVAVRGIFVHQSKLLCVKLKPYNMAVRQDYWCTIGGGVDDGESLQDAIVREVVEETGIKPVVGNIRYIQQYKTTEEECLEFFFEIINAHEYVQIDLSKTTHGQEEIAEIDFIDPSKNKVYPKFLQSIDFTTLNTASPVKLFNYL